jgi:hypothetical protein
MDLGDLGGEPVEPVMAIFTYFGKRFRVNPDLTETTIIDMFSAAAKVTVTDPRELTEQAEATVLSQVELAKDYVRGHIHPDDFDELWATAKANRQGIQQLMELCWKILELISERPTSPPSGSSGGRPVTSQSLPDGVSSPAGQEDDTSPSDHSWWPEDLPFSEAAANVVERFEDQGRPDLANQIMVTQENRVAASARHTG